MKHIAIVEDETLIREELATLLARAGYAVTAVTSFTDVPAQLRRLEPPCDLVLLDVNLPQKSGFALCRELKQTLPCAVLVLTSREALADELHALELGADEYLTKPYRAERLLARIGAVLKRYEGRANLLEGAGFLLDRHTYTLYWDGRSTVLSANQGALLAEFLARGGCATKEQLSMALWGTTQFIDEGALQVNLTRLKRALALPGLDVRIVAVPKVGYRLERGEA